MDHQLSGLEPRAPNVQRFSTESRGEQVWLAERSATTPSPIPGNHPSQFFWVCLRLHPGHMVTQRVFSLGQTFD